MYPDDFEADTAHLTLAEDGAYNRLLRLCWRTPGCSIPGDKEWIYRRLRAHSDQDRAVIDVVLDEFFTTKNGRCSNARLSKEWVAANQAHERRKNAGSKGGSAKAMKTNKTASSNAVAKPKQPEPEPEPYITEDTNVSSPKPPDQFRIPDGWVPSDDDWQYARDQGIRDNDIKETADEFQTYWSDRRDRSAKKSGRGWSQCWKSWVRRVSGRYKQGYRLDAKGGAARGGQGASIASIVLERQLRSEV